MPADDYEVFVQRFRASLTEGEEAAYDPEVMELLELIEAPVFDAIQRPLPRPSMARLGYVAAKPDGHADMYAMFMCWIDMWMNVLKNVFPDLDTDTDRCWHFASKHILTPELGGNKRAGDVVRVLVMRKIDEPPDGDERARDVAGEVGDESLTTFTFFHEHIFCKPPEFHNECALILLFMIKCAFFERKLAIAGDAGPERA
jgi:hypothetical protein